MKTKIVYCISTEDKDVYLEQLAVSLYSLKRNSPQTEALVLIDSISYNHLTDARKKMLSIADNVKSIYVGEGSGYYRSRILRTSVREYIEGPFLSIDSDTIIIRPLNELDNIDADIAAVQDANLLEFSSLHPTYRRSVYNCNKYFNFRLQDEPKYFSGGAIFSNDTPQAHKFFREWNANFIEGHKKGVVGDQQSLAYTNYQLGHPIREISGIWNCQMYYGVRFMPQACILHYFAWKNQNDDSEVSYTNPLQTVATYKEYKKTGIITDEIIKIIEDTSLIFDPYTRMIEKDQLKIMRSYSYRLLERMSKYKTFGIVEKIMCFVYERAFRVVSMRESID